MKIIARQLLDDALRHCQQNTLANDLLTSSQSENQTLPFVQISDMLFVRLLNHFAGTAIGNRFCAASINEVNRNGAGNFYNRFNELAEGSGNLERWLNAQSCDDLGIEDAAKLFVRYKRLSEQTRRFVYLASQNSDGMLVSFSPLFCAYNGEPLKDLNYMYILVGSIDDSLIIKSVDHMGETGHQILVSPFDVSCWSHSFVLTSELNRAQLGLIK